MKQSISELSILTGMDRRRIRKALADLPAEKGQKSALLYESTEALPLLYILPGDGDTYDLTQDRARLAHHQANKAELEAKTLGANFISVEQAAELVGEDYSNGRARLLSIPHKAAAQMIGLNKPGEAFTLLEGFVHDALEELTADQVYSGDS